MLLAVSAKRVTFTSNASSGSVAASGSCVSITLHCCRSSRATTKSVDIMVSILALFAAATFVAADEHFATATLFKTDVVCLKRHSPCRTPRGTRGDRLRHRMRAPGPGAAARLELLCNHALALFQHPVIAPPQVRRRAAQRPPRLGQRRPLFRGPAGPQAEADPHR